VNGQPVVHRIGNRAAEVAADDDDDQRVPQTRQRRTGAQAVHGIQAPQQQPHREDLRVPHPAVTVRERPEARAEAPAEATRHRRAAAARSVNIPKRGQNPFT
jgi:hypothetical protein